MSHIFCPFCAKYSPCSSFIPEELDDDIYLASFRGKGRGGGFEAYGHQSVMGDDFYTPFFLERTIKMLKAFIENGIISREKVQQELGISTYKLPSYSMCAHIPRSNIADRDEIARLNDELSKKEERIRNIETLDDVLNNIFFYSKYVIRFDDYANWYVSIEKLAHVSHLKLFLTYGHANPSLKNMLNRKIKGGNFEVNLLLDSMRNQPKMKTVSEKLLEFPL